MKFTIEIHETEQGFAATFPELPGCFTQGGTEAELIENAKDAIVTHLTALAKLQKRAAPETGHARLAEVEIFPSACHA